MRRAIAVVMIAGAICFTGSPAFGHLSPNGVSTKGTPGNNTPGNGVPANSAPANGAPGNGAPANGAAANGAPANNGATSLYDARSCVNPKSHCISTRHNTSAAEAHQQNAASAHERAAANCLEQEAAELFRAEQLRGAAASDRQRASHLTENATTNQVSPTIPPGTLLRGQAIAPAPAEPDHTGQASGASDPTCPPAASH